MTGSPSVVVHFKDLEVDDSVRRSIERRCDQLAGEFHELDRIELTVTENGAGFSVHGHATGKHTDVATHARADDLRPAADQVLGRIERQLRKLHDKRIFSQRREAQRDPPKRRESS